MVRRRLLLLLLLLLVGVRSPLHEMEGLLQQVHVKQQGLGLSLVALVVKFRQPVPPPKGLLR